VVERSTVKIIGHRFSPGEAVQSIHDFIYVVRQRRVAPLPLNEAFICFHLLYWAFGSLLTAKS
jgi:hypothetical protein